MSPSDDSLGAQSRSRWRPSWLLAGDRFTASAGPAGATAHAAPGATSGPAAESLAPSRSVENPGNGAVSGTPTPTGETVPAPAVVPADAPGRRSIISRWHLMRLAVLVVVAVVIAVGISNGRAPDTSAEPTVQSFLLAWEDGQYAQAAQFTTGNPATVATALRTAYVQLDAAALYLNMGPISQQGHTAVARFTASVILGQDGFAWNYGGWFPLRWTAHGWKIQWSLSDINPGLQAGSRLAVRTTLPPRAQVLGSSGQPLQQLACTYVAGVVPSRLASASATAEALSQATGLSEDQVEAYIQGGPGNKFDPLVTLAPASYARLKRQLKAVPGLVIHRVKRRLFSSIAADVVGSVGSEVSSAFRTDGVAYQPGDTVGLSGLQQYYQRRLVGAPMTEVVAEDSAGHVTTVLRKWAGPAPQPVRTTISPAAQSAANAALGGTSHAAAIVAMQASTGKLLAVASQRGQGVAQPNPLAGRYSPGQAFTIVSSAALLGTGLAVGAPVPCTTASDVGGKTFTNDPPSHRARPRSTFSRDFADGCGTAFAGLSRRLSATGLSAAATGLGLGSTWRLPLATFAGSMSSPATDAELAADTMGTGNILVSPLSMALIAARVDSGEWHDPSLVLRPDASSSGSGLTAKPGGKSPLTGQVMTALRGLMRGTVRYGDARVADLPGVPVYGQAGQAPFSQAASGTVGRALPSIDRKSAAGSTSSSGSSGSGSAGRSGHGGGTSTTGKTRHNLQAWWFVGYRGNVAFAVLEVGKGPGSAAPLAAHFLRALPASLLTP
jgi:cell division protein FtsI/penicillin-binding protein 2